MKRFRLVTAVISLAAASIANQATAADVGVSLSIGQPGFYGRIDIGDYPAPRTVYRQPLLIERVAYERPPIYLNVPPGHSRNWRRYCSRYNACGERVYFVTNNWYEREYVPRYRAQHRDSWHERHDRDGHNGHDNRHGNRHGRDDHDGRGH